MTHKSFVKLIAQDIGSTYERLMKNPTFAINTNMRGKKLIRVLENQGVTFHKKNVLDVGCAYGGMSIEPAKKGASVIGIDIDRKLLNYAEENASGDAEVEFRKCDASAAEFREIVPSAWADVIIINDVLEHIYDTVALVDNLSYAAKKGCLLYYVVPNGRSIRFVEREGHRKIFGISIIDPDCWQYFLPGRKRIFYRRWPYFESIFHYYGFVPHEDLTEFKVPLGEMKEYVKNAAANLENIYKKWKAPNKEAEIIANEEISKFLEEVNRDLLENTNYELAHLYGADFWNGIRRKV